MRRSSLNRRQFIGTALAGVAATLASRAVAETRFLVGEKQLLALSDGHFNMPASMFLGTPESLRNRLLDMISADGLIMGAAHVSRPGLGRVERNGDSFRFLPL